MASVYFMSFSARFFGGQDSYILAYRTHSSQKKKKELVTLCSELKKKRRSFFSIFYGEALRASRDEGENCLIKVDSSKSPFDVD